jgi:hypothetical protein
MVYKVYRATCLVVVVTTVRRMQSNMRTRERVVQNSEGNHDNHLLEKPRVKLLNTINDVANLFI